MRKRQTLQKVKPLLEITAPIGFAGTITGQTSLAHHGNNRCNDRKFGGGTAIRQL